MLKPRVSRKTDRRSSFWPRLGWRVWRSRSPAVRMFFVLWCRFLCSVSSVFFSFPLSQAEWGEGDLGDTPTIAAQAGSGAGNGYTGGKAKSCLLFAVPC